MSGGVVGCARGWGSVRPSAARRGGCGPAHGRSMRGALPAYHLRATALLPSPRISSMTYRVQDPVRSFVSYRREHVIVTWFLLRGYFLMT